MSEPVIAIKSLAKSYDAGGETRVALTDFSLDVERGDLVCILGRNGSGKSTLFSCICGLLPFEQGEITISLGGDHVTINSSSQAIPMVIRKKMGIVFQDSALWPHRSVLANVAAPLWETRGIDRKEAEMRATDWLRKLHVSESAWKRLPQMLSGGQQRRVAIARTLATRPDVLLLDELEVHLDPEAVEIVLQLVEEEYVRDPGKTLLMVTHRVDFINLSSNVIYLDQGVLMKQGPPREFMENRDPSTFFYLVMDPRRSELTLAEECFKRSINVSALISNVSSENTNDIFNNVASEISKLITQLENASPNLVLIATKDNASRLPVRGASMTPDFILDGDSISKFSEPTGPEEPIRHLVSPTPVPRNVGEDFKNRLCSGQVVFGPSGSLIAMMFEQDDMPSYMYTPSHPPIAGVYYTSIPQNRLERNFIERRAYCEFSKRTRSVYLFNMMHEREVIGVISIDTYSDVKWRPFVVEHLKLIASISAIAVKRMMMETPRISTEGTQRSSGSRKKDTSR